MVMVSSRLPERVHGFPVPSSSVYKERSMIFASVLLSSIHSASPVFGLGYSAEISKFMETVVDVDAGHPVLAWTV